MAKKIYIFVNSKWTSGDVVAVALCEDGTPLGSHFSSNENFAKHDMGLTSDWKHETYKKHCPDGYELEWVDDDKIKTHPGLMEAYKLNQEWKEPEPPVEAPKVDKPCGECGNNHDGHPELCVKPCPCIGCNGKNWTPKSPPSQCYLKVHNGCVGDCSICLNPWKPKDESQPKNSKEPEATTTPTEGKK